MPIKHTYSTDSEGHVQFRDSDREGKMSRMQCECGSFKFKSTESQEIANFIAHEFECLNCGKLQCLMTANPTILAVFRPTSGVL